MLRDTPEGYTPTFEDPKKKLQQASTIHSEISQSTPAYKQENKLELLDQEAVSDAEEIDHKERSKHNKFIQDHGKKLIKDYRKHEKDQSSVKCDGFTFTEEKPSAQARVLKQKSILNKVKLNFGINRK